MNYVKCFDVVSMIVDDANERFAPLWGQNEEKLLILQQYCRVIDKLSKEFEGVYFDIFVNEITMEIHIKLGCVEIKSKKGLYLLIEIVKYCISFGIYPEKNDLLSLHFVFSGIWERGAKGGC